AIAVLAIGRLMPVIAQGRTEEELEKRLGAALLHGDQLISIDNCDHELQSSFLCQALTQQRLNIRVLGFSQNVETPVNAAIFATGNNLTIVGDLNRRTLLCSMDAQCEHPEQRQFPGDLIQYVRTNRTSLIAAALTALRAWHVSGQTLDAGKLLGSFEDWSYRVRGPLLWLNRADPCETVLTVKESDPRRLALATVLAQWRQHLGIGGVYTVQDVINRALNINEFHVALANVAAAGSGNILISNRRLGIWLKKVEGRIVGNLMLKQTGIKDGYPIWSLKQST